MAPEASGKQEDGCGRTRPKTEGSSPPGPGRLYTLRSVMSQIAGPSAGIIGPVTTSAYVGADGLRRLTADYHVDYILNGRPMDANGRTHLLVEMIRVSDGVHVWVRPYDDLTDRRQVGAHISRNVIRVLELP